MTPTQHHTQAHRITAYLIAVLLITLAGACSSHKGNRPQGTDADQHDTLQLALMPTLDCLPFYVAAQCGLYDSLALPVHINTYYALFDTDTAITNHRADVAYTDLIHTALLQQQGVPVYAIMQAEGTHSLVTTAAKRITRLSQLKERMVAIARHSVTDWMLDTTIAMAGIDPALVYHPQINDIVLRHRMIENGTIDAAFLPEPYVSQLKLKGHRVINHTQQLQFRPMTFVATAGILRQDSCHHRLSRLFTAYAQAATLLNNGTVADTVRLILERHGISRQTTDSLTLPHYNTRPNGVVQHNVQTALQFLQRRNLVKGTYTADTLCHDLTTTGQQQARPAQPTPH